jgi:trehalose 6-phosphate phosphatase
MLLEAIGELGAAPGHTAVLEDSIAGVKAGVAGGFGLIIGVARGEGGDALQRAGAHLLVHDASEFILSDNTRLMVKTLSDLPSVWDREEDIRRRVSGKSLAVFLDYDGTLTPIVEDHTRALLSVDMRAAVAALGKRCTVVIVSGRDLTMLRGLVQLDSVGYAGSHGFEILSPEGSSVSLERGVEFLPELDRVEQELREPLAGIKGHAIERKRFSIALHYRQVAQDDIGKLESILDRVLAGHPSLCRGFGKKVFELKPDIDWNKGYAVLWILERLRLDRPEIIPLYIGDDLTDEDAFHVLAGRGLTVAVRDHETRQTAADFAVNDTTDVKRFLEMLVSIPVDAQEADGGGS